MYHTKIATSELEMQAIARLNYETFVEEIPQHAPNDERMLIDKFHHENTYIVLYHDQELIGMLAFRDKRPFSIDMKIGEVENYLPADACTKLCEVRLLAIKQQYRVGRVFLRLAQALYAYVLDKNYSACVISGVTSQLHLYEHIGFKQFAAAVGDEGARFIPMVLTSEAGHQFYQQFQQKHAVFFPGPVQQLNSLSNTTVSHRSAQFKRMLHKLTDKLVQLSGLSKVAFVNGSGTLANDMMLLQVKAQVNDKHGVICTNGEFGERLVKQARALHLQFDVYEEIWGQPFNEARVEQAVQQASWCVFVHGETSTGMLNDLSMFVELKKRYGLLLAVDCISSFGAVPFTLQNVDFATATSGKAIGALAGVSFVFYEGKLASNGAVYLDLSRYEGNTPFTLPAYLVGNVLERIDDYPARYEVLQKRLQHVLAMKHLELLNASHYPTAVSFKASEQLILDAQLNGFELHAMSEYLRQRHETQISTIQPTFDKDFAAFMKWIAMYNKVK